MTKYLKRIKRQRRSGEPQTEYDLQKWISRYMNQYHPEVEYRVDARGINMSKAAASKFKATNKRKSWHDFEIYDPSGEWSGLCLELKKASVGKLVLTKDSTVKAIIEYKTVGGKKYPIRENRKRKAGEWKSPHLENQAENVKKMAERGRLACFGIGIEACLGIIEGYLNNDKYLLKQYMTPEDIVVNNTLL